MIASELSIRATKQKRISPPSPPSTAYAVVNTVATLDTEERTIDSQTQWFRHHGARNRVIVVRISTTNRKSIRPVERCGFVDAGIMRVAGYKFGAWLDVASLQLLFNGATR